VLQGGQFSQSSVYFDRATTHLVGGPLNFDIPTADAAAASTNTFPFGATSAFIADFNGRWLLVTPRPALSSRTWCML
jgi:hypothetical protein